MRPPSPPALARCLGLSRRARRPCGATLRYQPGLPPLRCWRCGNPFLALLDVADPRAVVPDREYPPDASRTTLEVAR